MHVDSNNKHTVLLLIKRCTRLIRTLKRYQRVLSNTRDNVDFDRIFTSKQLATRSLSPNNSRLSHLPPIASDVSFASSAFGRRRHFHSLHRARRSDASRVPTPGARHFIHSLHCGDLKTLRYIYMKKRICNF